MIAADENQNGSITTSDVVQLRKLILGIYTTMPDQNSWRFVDKSFTFTYSNNPFFDIFPESRSECLSSKTALDFVAIKIGDVNGSAIANRPAPRPAVTIGWDRQNLKAGQTYTIPIVYNGNEVLDAIQLGIKFDTQKLSFIAPSQGNLSFSLDNFGLTHSDNGEIRTLWFPFTGESGKIWPGEVLFNLTFKVLNDLLESEPLISLNNNILDNIAWRSDGTEFTVSTKQGSNNFKQPQFKQGSALNVNLWPNPSSGSITLTLEVSEQSTFDLNLYGPMGDLVLTKKLSLEKGVQDIPISELSEAPSGLYFWNIQGDGKVAQGRLVKN
jgi:hypothetical protein